MRPWMCRRLHGVDRSAQKTVQLSNGQYFRFEIDVSLWENYEDDSWEVLVQPSIIVHDERWSRSVHDKEGTATGPGGVEVLEIGLELLRQSEQVALALSSAMRERVVYEVEAATPRLFRIYRRYLEPRGYVYEEFDWGYALRKTLREAQSAGT